MIVTRTSLCFLWRPAQFHTHFLRRHRHRLPGFLISKHAYTHVHTHKHTHKHMHARARAHTNTHANIHARAHTRAHTHTRLCSGAPAWGVPTTQRAQGGPPSRNPPTPDIHPSFCSFLRKDFLRRHRDGQFRNFCFLAQPARGFVHGTQK